jgi:hypothetical protein
MRNSSKFYFVVYLKSVNLFWYIFVGNLKVSSHHCFYLYFIYRNHLRVLCTLVYIYICINHDDNLNKMIEIHFYLILRTCMT